ncbi:MAG: ABC transporter permease subunit [Halieaceae bacterium]|nr:ABC transporter permease subunit [Halieaceae bacterium]
MRSPGNAVRSSLSASRRWIDRVATVAVTIGATLVLLAIASIFLFLVWASWPLFWSGTTPDAVTHKFDMSGTIISALSETEYLTQDADSGNFKIISLKRQAGELHQAVVSDVIRLAIDQRDSSVLATVSSTGLLRLYSDYDWWVSASSQLQTQEPIVSEQLAGVPEALRVQVENNNVFHVLLRYQNRVEWLSAYSESGPVTPTTEFRVQRQLRLDTSVDLSRLFLISQGGLLLKVDEDGRYQIYDRDLGISSGRFSNISGVDKVQALRSSYGVSVVDAANLVHIYGLSFGEQGPVFNLLDQYRPTDQEVDNVFASPFGGLITSSSSGNLEWFDTDFRSQRHFPLPANSADGASALSWHMTPEGSLVGTTVNKIFVVRFDARDRSLGVSGLFEGRMYEGYQSPQYIWQSMPLAPTSESKFSITPLLMGTLKAAFYSLLFAAPLAIAAAIFTSYFLAADMRARIKPLVELLAAIPTVILGLVAGLWFAPWLEKNLGLILLFSVAVPFCLYLASRIWRLLPGNRTEARLSGFELLFSAVAIAVAALIASVLTDVIGGETSQSLVSFLAQRWGLEYEQRNAIVVGLVMGFAVIPTIYSIAEDALAAVPSYLREGALAMGASEWQAAKSVVLPTAAPGIISAIMMGFARAVGETMIVLMATGNTPTMDASLLTGLRTLSATLALEMPEVVPDSLHFHVLMFIALLLFLFTFVLNSFAEWVRVRLRERVAQL